MAEAKPGLVHDGNYLVTWVDTIADISAPTTTELSAGMALECQVTPDGLAREASDESVNTSRLCSVFTTTKVGRTSFEVSLTLVKVDTSGTAVDEAYDTLKKGKTGYLVIRDNKSGSDPYAVGDEVEVYPAECGTRSKAAPAANELQTFTLPLNVHADPDLYSVVA
jgi:hypothetical protein